MSYMYLPTVHSKNKNTLYPSSPGWLLGVVGDTPTRPVRYANLLTRPDSDRTDPTRAWISNTA